MSGPRSVAVPRALHEPLRALFAGRGHTLARNPRNPYIAFEVRTDARSIFTFYTSGKLVQTVRDGDAAAHELSAAVAELLGGAPPSASPGRGAPRALSTGVPSSRLLVGVDETGTGELFGQVVLGGARVGRAGVEALAALVGHVDTKVSRAPSGWASLWERLCALEVEGLRLRALPVPNALFDVYNKNELLDLAYVRLVGDLIADLDDEALEGTEIVVDDYGVGARLRDAIEIWRGRGARVLVERKADDTHLVARAGSVVAKAQRAREMAALAAEATDGPLGSGNAGDARTRSWLRRWRRTDALWPSFVKTSFRTVRELDGLGPVDKRPVPDPERLLDARSARAWRAGRLDVTRARLRCGGRLRRHVDVTADGGPLAASRTLALAFVPLLVGGVVLGEDLLDVERLAPLLELDAGPLCGARVLVGPGAGADDAVLVALARAHHGGLVHLVHTAWAAPAERAAREQAVILSGAPPRTHLGLRLVEG